MAKDRAETSSKAIKDTTKDVRDTASEVGHRVAAEGEELKRSVAGKEMTTGQKLGSVANEAKHRAQAEIDAGKRDIRDEGADLEDDLEDSP